MDVLQNSVNVLAGELAEILGGSLAAAYLTGSAALGDFREGWSDIDILCFTKDEISGEAAEKLLNLRQELDARRPGEYYRMFEGGILPLSVLEGKKAPCVYWGTGGQRLTDGYDIGVFGTMELLDSGILLLGEDVRGGIDYPSADMIKAAVREHYGTVRRYAVPRESLHSAGWLLDIARCIYTLRTGKIIAKTAAGEWAIERGLVPDPTVMERVIGIRKEPLKYKNDGPTLGWIAGLGDEIQRFADVLEREIDLN